MTVHASNELVYAVQGREPASSSATEAKADRYNACGTPATEPRGANPHATALVTSAWPSDLHWGAREQQMVVDCPKCIVLLFKASDPMRWDYLLQCGRLDTFVKVT